VNLDDRNLGAVLVGVLVERDQAWFVRLHEVDEAWHSLLLLVDLSRLEPIGGDEDEWTRHGTSSFR